jgi:glycosyltransferase involved in cell wall biosynthesis
LWQRAAVDLARRGYRVTVMKPRLALNSQPVRQLREAGCLLLDLTRPFYLPGRLFGLLSFVSRPAALFLTVARLWLALLLRRPKLAILSQGGNWDGFLFGLVLARLNVPYVIISQKATELYWPPDHLSDSVRRLYESALHAYFVSNHNLRLTELQIGATIPSASVARNPFLVPYEHVPSPLVHRDVVDFACVARLYPMEKGQDLLLNVLAQEKWRKRPVALTFYGEGIQRSSLERMVKLLGLTNVRFAGHVPDIQDVWQHHTGLLLGSRCEGLPLVIVEAMLAGRLVIATDAGGSAEVIEDGVTGFIAEAPTVGAIDDAMERAWRDRPRWAEIAARGAEAIRQTIPPDPGTAFVSDLLHRTAFLIASEPMRAQSTEAQSHIATEAA